MTPTNPPATLAEIHTDHKAAYERVRSAIEREQASRWAGLAECLRDYKPKRVTATEVAMRRRWYR